MNLSTFSELLCLIQGVVFGIILVYFSSAKKPSLYMGLFLLSWGLYFVTPVMGPQGYFNKYPLLAFIPLNLCFISFPFLYLYIKRLTGEYSFNRDKKHLYPGLVIMACFLLLFFIFLDVPGIDISKHPFYSSGLLTLLVLANTFILVYLLKMRGLVKKNALKVLEVHSSVEYKLLTWLNPLIYAFLFLTIFDFVFTIILMIISADPTIFSAIYKYIDGFQDIIEVIITYWAAIFAIKQSTVWVGNSTAVVPQKMREEVIVDLDDLYEHLTDTIENTMCFKNMELTIVDLAHLMDMHYVKLSKVIKQKTNMNFNTFINKYRIEEAKAIMRDPQKFRGLTFDVLGQKVGFKAKSSFYNAFKKFEDTTPSKFQKSQNH